MEKIKIKAPARVCLFGEHQDYLGYPVIACAIDRYISLEAIENGSNFLNIQLPDIAEHRSISIHETFPILQKRDYFASGLRVLGKKGIFPNKGFDILIKGDIPIKSGLSSSSALCATWTSFLVRAFSEQAFSKSELAQMVYECEVAEHGEPGGNMDQFSIVFGGLVKITTREPFEVEQLNDPEMKLLIADSGIQKDTLGLLSKTKENSLEALLQVKINQPELDFYNANFNEVEGPIGELNKDLSPYFIAAIRGHDITRSAVKEFQKKTVDLSLIAKLMNEHQDLLCENLNVSIPKMDKMIKEALRAGALSAKLVGSGGGGCIVVLVDDHVEEVKRSLQIAGAANVFETQLSKGAYELNFA